MKTVPANDKTKVLAAIHWPTKGCYTMFNYNKLVTAEEVHDKAMDAFPRLRCEFLASVDKVLKNGDIRRTISFAYHNPLV